MVMNADTGAVLAMAGQKHEQGAQDFKANALGTITDVFIPGSVVKGATLTAGWRSGAIYGNQVLTDQPINIAGSALLRLGLQIKVAVLLPRHRL